MELVFSRKDMVRAMSMVSRVAGKPAILPVLSHVLISAGRDPLWDTSQSSNGDRIYVAATDLEVGIRTGIPGQIAEGGAVALPARTFASVINSLAEEEVKLIASGDRASISCDKGEFKMVGLSAHEFPSMMGEAGQDAQMELTTGTEEKKETYLFSLSSDVFGRMLRKASFAASRDADQYFLNGVHLSLKNGASEGNGMMVRTVATDGRRLAIAEATADGVIEKDVGVIIPNRAVGEIRKLIANAEMVKIGFQNKRIIFSFASLKDDIVVGDTTLVSALIEGDYPDYERAIPAQTSIVLKVDTGRLLSAARRMAQVANPKMPYVMIEARGSKLAVSASSPYVGDGCEDMDIVHEGDDINVALNIRYLMDALFAIDTQETLVGINGAVLPVVIKPSSVPAPDGNNLGSVRGHLCVLMPIRVTDSRQPPTENSGAGVQEGDET